MSIYSSLSLALCGASSQTRQAIARALLVHVGHFAHYEQTPKLLGEHLDGVSAGDELHTLLQANGVFIDGHFEVNPVFKEHIEKYFHGKVKNLNFKSQSEESRGFINQWVEEHTANKIKELMPSGSIDGDTKLVLANAIYFKGNFVLNVVKYG